MPDEPQPPVPAELGPARPQGIDLCLSGGGFRATLFHLGVILYLKLTNNLHRVKNVYAVSGGAVLGADLVSRWQNYKDSDRNSLAQLLSPLLHPITRRSFRDRAITYWAYSFLFPFVVMVVGTHFIPFWWGLWASIAVGIALLFLRLRYLGLNTWGRCLYGWWFSFRVYWRNLSPDGPKLYLLATDLLTGRLGEFSRNGFRLVPDQVSQAGMREQNHPLALAVNASAAFPPMFPPQVVSNDGEMAVLTDGGVFDNLGICDWQETGGPARNSLCLVSDAGCDFVNERTGFWYGFSVVLRNARSSDISMNRLAEKDLQLDQEARHISIRSTDRSTKILPASVRMYVPRVRTDLDRFTWQEAVALIVHGLDVAESANATDMGSLDENDRTIVYATLRQVLGVKNATEFAISHTDLERSHIRNFVPRLWHVLVVYGVAALYALHLLGNLPSQGFGILYNLSSSAYAAVLGPSTFHQVLDRKRNAEFTSTEILKQAFSEHTSDQNNLIYESDLFAGPIAPSYMALTFKREGLTERELTVDGDFFAILIPESKSQPGPLWLPCKVLNESELRISVPPFRGFGRILLSADSPHPIKLDRKAYKEVP